jgi:hypothetical protein
MKYNLWWHEMIAFQSAVRSPLIPNLREGFGCVLPRYEPTYPTQFLSLLARNDRIYCPRIPCRLQTGPATLLVPCSSTIFLHQRVANGPGSSRLLRRHANSGITMVRDSTPNTASDSGVYKYHTGSHKLHCVRSALIREGSCTGVVEFIAQGPELCFSPKIAIFTTTPYIQ